MALVILMGHQTPVGPLLTCSLSRMVFIEHLSHVGTVLGAGETTGNGGGGVKGRPFQWGSAFQ